MVKSPLITHKFPLITNLVCAMVKGYWRTYDWHLVVRPVWVTRNFSQRNTRFLESNFHHISRSFPDTVFHHISRCFMLFPDHVPFFPCVFHDFFRWVFHIFWLGTQATSQTTAEFNFRQVRHCNFTERGAELWKKSSNFGYFCLPSGKR
jgi:hypothetical protein